MPARDYVNPPDLKKLLAANEDFYRNLHLRMDYRQKLYMQQYEGIVAIPENVSMHRSSTSTQMVDELRDQIRIDEPLVDSLVFGTSERARKRQTQQRLWGAGMINALGNDGPVNAFNQVRHDLVSLGASGMKWGVKPSMFTVLERQRGESAAEFEEREEAWQVQRQVESPYTLKAIDPRNLYPSPGPGPLRYMLEVQSRRVMDMWEEYPEWTDPKSKKRMSRKQQYNPLRTVKWVEYWSWVWLADEQRWAGRYIAEGDDERVLDMPNIYLQVPYEYGFSGLGRTADTGDPAALGIGILDRSAGEIEEEVKLKTALSAAWQFYVFPRLVAEGVPAKELAAMMAVGPGGIITLPTVGSAKWLDPPEPNASAIAFLEKIESNLHRSVSPALSGQRTADYGIHQALQIGQAVKSAIPIQAAINRMAAGMLGGIARLTHFYQFNMHVHGKQGPAEESRRIRWQDLKNAAFEVSFEAVDPAENDRRMLAALSVKREGDIISRETYRRTWLKGILDSSEDEETRLMAEKISDQMVEQGFFLQFVTAEMQNQLQSGQAQETTQAAVGKLRERAETVGRGAAIESLAGVATTEFGEQAAEVGLEGAEL